MLHMFWSCSELKPYWRNIVQTIKIINVKLPYDPRLMLLGDESVLQLNQRNLHLVKMALIATKKCIAIQWKSVEPPSHMVWLRELASYVPVEKILFNLRKKSSMFEKIWGKFIEYINNLDVTLTENADVIM